jgi:hypothetical protein
MVARILLESGNGLIVAKKLKKLTSIQKLVTQPLLAVMII